MASGFDFRVLGPLEVRYDGVPVTVGAARQRTLLAVLLMHANQVVSLDELVRIVWEEHPTTGARTTVQNYVMRLRNVLRGVAGTSPIVTASDGYLISVGESELDVWRFRELVAQARAGDPELASKLLADARGLWRGKPLADVQSETLRREEAPRLHEQLLSAEELRFDVELGLGRHNAIIGELRDLTVSNPLRERFWAQLITALYRSGRQAEALQTFQDVRRVLADELGIDPGPELLALHQQVLTGDTALAGLVARQPLPRQLPPPVGGFVGRSAELKVLDQLLTRQPSMALISAGGGFGKTSLVLRWAHDRIDRFPDGQLFVNLRGFDPSGPSMQPTNAVRGFLEAFGVAPTSMPVELEAQTALYRSLVADKRMLIVLDNALDSAQVAPLLPGSPTCTVLVTSRNQLGGLMTAHQALPLALDVLGEHEARDLLAAHLGEDRVAAEPAAVAEIVERCASLPLALSIVAARASGHPDFPLSTLADDLTEARLDALDAGDLSANLRAVFACSYNALGSAAAEVYGLLGLAPGPDIGLPAAASLTGLPPARARNLLRELENSHLVSQYVPGRYRMHDLVRLYAAERGLPGPVREAALSRLVDYYLRSAFSGEMTFLAHHRPVRLPPPAPGARPEEFTDQAAAVAWFNLEHLNILLTLRLAAERTWDQAVFALAWSLSTYHWRRSHTRYGAMVWQAAISAGQRLGPQVATAHRLFGRALIQAGQLDEALDQLQQAQRRVADDDVAEQAQIHHTFAWLWENRGDDHEALKHARRGLALFEAAGDQAGAARAYNVVGWYLARIGEFEQGLEYCERALELTKQQDRAGQHGVLDSLGYIARGLGDNVKALGYYEQALTLNRELGNTFEQPRILESIGGLRQKVGDPTRARQTWIEARQIYTTQGRLNDVERVQRLLDALDGD
ncbi:BTAD domain-containing putative transcriptional regulator [Kutzneria buriramensis]|uniref:DNA-binding SARP family transcriptional activator n=1 Tax=Kutzneria buriramensis TaxID=1045776 RepID=A0A3E0I8U4_9PSEU|nr:BTAD domain-containing putative transcriptional regulator [Kutzneria buriramensis]REH55049.1 DNA-binding SARP family transcriptional activator [Kutzneria buriramensis]